MTTAAQQREAGARTPPTHVGAPPRARAAASRRQVALVRAVAAALVAGTVAGVIALGDDTRDVRQPPGRFAIPQFDDARVVKGARGGTFDDPRVAKGARGGNFDDPVVQKGAGGAPIR